VNETEGDISNYQKNMMMELVI